MKLVVFLKDSWLWLNGRSMNIKSYIEYWGKKNKHSMKAYSDIKRNIYAQHKGPLQDRRVKKESLIKQLKLIIVCFFTFFFI